MVPLIAGDQARGLIDLIDMEHEHAFSESDVRLLQTLANCDERRTRKRAAL